MDAVMQVKALVADEFLDLVGDAAMVPHGVLDVLDRHIPSLESRLQIIDLDRESIQVWRRPELDMVDRALDPAAMRLLFTHPLFEHFRENHSFDPMRWSDVVDVDEFVATDLYQAYYAEDGISDQLAARLDAPFGLLIMITLTRKDATFTDEERETLRMVRKTIDHVVRQARLGIRHEATITALAGRNWNGVVVDDFGTVRSTYMGKIEGTEVGKPLPSELMRTFNDWHASPRPRHVLCSGGIEGSVRIGEIGIGENLVMYRPPTDAKHNFLRELGLTKRQADTAVALHGGGTNYQIARQLGISESTVKKHLERVYALLNVDNRAAAVGTISGLDTTAAP